MPLNINADWIARRLLELLSILFVATLLYQLTNPPSEVESATPEQAEAAVESGNVNELQWIKAPIVASPPGTGSSQERVIPTPEHGRAIRLLWPGDAAMQQSLYQYLRDRKSVV